MANNVKPGDMAKLIRDDTFPWNVGAVMVVKSQYVPPSGYVLPFMNRGLWPLWLCTTLQPVKAYADVLGREAGRVVTVQAGNDYVAADAWLKRIDPPADTSQVFGHEPLPGERWIENQQLPEGERWNKELES